VLVIEHVCIKLSAEAILKYHLRIDAIATLYRALRLVRRTERSMKAGRFAQRGSVPRCEQKNGRGVAYNLAGATAVSVWRRFVAERTAVRAT
jgi:hypothetical protein